MTDQTTIIAIQHALKDIGKPCTEEDARTMISKFRVFNVFGELHKNIVEIQELEGKMTTAIDELNLIADAEFNRRCGDAGVVDENENV